MTRDEVAQLLREARREYRSKFTLSLFIIIGYYSGARKSAILNLKWEQVNFVTNMLDFRDLEVDRGNKHRARIPMPPKLRDFLFRRFKKYGRLSQYIFHQKNNPSNPVRHIEKGFRAAAKRAGLYDVTPHTLRHTRVSELAQRGEKIPNISAYMAMSEQTIWGVYAHVNNEDVQDMANRIGRSQNVRRKPHNDQ